jgi:hypothetical protein
MKKIFILSFITLLSYTFSSCKSETGKEETKKEEVKEKVMKQTAAFSLKSAKK